MSEADVTIRPLEREDREWVAHFLDEYWGSTQIVTRGRALYGHLLPGFVAERPKPPEAEPDVPDDDDETAENPIVHMEKVGLLTYNLENDECEIVTLDSKLENSGVGTALVDAIKEAMGADKAELATEEEFEELFPECELGAMPPFGNLYDMDTLVAESLTEDEEIAFNAGTHKELVKMSYSDFAELAQPKVLPVGVRA